MNQVSLDQLSAAQFTEVLHTEFQVLVEAGASVRLGLIAMTTHSPGSPGFEAFSLLFEGPADRPLDQQTYRFAHERLGSFDLFIVPLSATAKARQYEAVFNRRASQ